jgi:hypothetical protein
MDYKQVSVLDAKDLGGHPWESGKKMHFLWALGSIAFERCFK